MVVSAQRVREPLRHRCALALLEHGDHDQLVSVAPAHVDEAGTPQVVNLHGPAAVLDRSTGRNRERDPGRDLGPGFERSADPLSKALDGVFGYGDEHLGRLESELGT
jgi:hypothetical protein